MFRITKNLEFFFSFFLTAAEVCWFKNNVPNRFAGRKGFHIGIVNRTAMWLNNGILQLLVERHLFILISFDNLEIKQSSHKYYGTHYTEHNRHNTNFHFHDIVFGKIGHSRYHPYHYCRKKYFFVKQNKS